MSPRYEGPLLPWGKFNHEALGEIIAEIRGKENLLGRGGQEKIKKKKLAKGIWDFQKKEF